LLPRVQQHLDCCPQCYELYEGLRQIAGLDH
jgi:hypothetical protein